MRKQKTLIGLLRGLVELITEEAGQNPEFERKLEQLLSDLPENSGTSRKKQATRPPEQIPDIHAEWKERDETGFRLWLRKQQVSVLRAVIRAEDLDATRRTSKWKEAEKLADYITDKLRERQSRGSSFFRGETQQ